MLTSSQYLIRMMPESIIARSTATTCSKNVSTCVFGGKAHHPLDTGPVVPTAVEDHDFAGRREMRHVALDVHLRFLALGRRRQRDHAKDARADAFGDALDRSTLAGGVAAFEDDADLGAGGFHPLLELDQLDLKRFQLLLELLAPSSAAGCHRLPR